MNPIDTVFAELRKANRKAFIPFVSAGDPDVAATAKIVRELDDCGCHLVEIGFPFSDPIADGPVIQAAYTRALDRGLKVDDIFNCVDGLKRATEPIRAPLVGMVSYFADPPPRARRVPRPGGAGRNFAGLIVPDLARGGGRRFRPDKSRLRVESDHAGDANHAAGRAERIVKLSSGFVYCVSVAGITGERDRLPDELLVQLRQLRGMTDLPLCVGFGVSRPEHVRMLRTEVDGVIVGSAIVRRLEKATATNWPAVAAEIRELVRSLLDALNRRGVDTVCRNPIFWRKMTRSPRVTTCRLT